MQKIMSNIFLLFGYGFNCNGFLITSEEGESLLIDSGLGKFDASWGYSVNNPTEELLSCLKYRNVKQIILTHAHLDHSGGVASLKPEQREGITIYCHENERSYLELPDSLYINPINKFSLDPITITKSVSNGDNLVIGDYVFEIIHTPGHTEGSMCLFDPDKKILFSGDCVFPEGAFGRVDFTGSNPEKMLSSLEHLASLDIESLFAGHMEPLISDAKNSIRRSYQNAKLMI